MPSSEISLRSSNEFYYTLTYFTVLTNFIRILTNVVLPYASLRLINLIQSFLKRIL
nr:MAG TPA: hypothetical protein [Caudoviricetes sp.]